VSHNRGIYFGEPHGAASRRFLHVRAAAKSLAWVTQCDGGGGGRRYDLCKCPRGGASVRECVGVRVELKGDVPRRRRKSRGGPFSRDGVWTRTRLNGGRPRDGSVQQQSVGRTVTGWRRAAERVARYTYRYKYYTVVAWWKGLWSSRLWGGTCGDYTGVEDEGWGGDAAGHARKDVILMPSGNAYTLIYIQTFTRRYT